VAAIARCRPNWIANPSDNDCGRVSSGRTFRCRNRLEVWPGPVRAVAAGQCQNAWIHDKVLILTEGFVAPAAGWPVTFDGQLIPEVRVLPAGISSSRHSR